MRNKSLSKIETEGGRLPLVCIEYKKKNIQISRMQKNKINQYVLEEDFIEGKHYIYRVPEGIYEVTPNCLEQDISLPAFEVKNDTLTHIIYEKRLPIIQFCSIGILLFLMLSLSIIFGIETKFVFLFDVFSLFLITGVVMFSKVTYNQSIFLYSSQENTPFESDSIIDISSNVDTTLKEQYNFKYTYDIEPEEYRFVEKHFEEKDELLMPTEMFRNPKIFLQLGVLLGAILYFLWTIREGRVESFICSFLITICFGTFLRFYVSTRFYRIGMGAYSLLTSLFLIFFPGIYQIELVLVIFFLLYVLYSVSAPMIFKLFFKSHLSKLLVKLPHTEQMSSAKGEEKTVVYGTTTAFRSVTPSKTITLPYHAILSITEDDMFYYICGKGNYVYKDTTYVHSTDFLILPLRKTLHMINNAPLSEMVEELRIKVQEQSHSIITDEGEVFEDISFEKEVVLLTLERSSSIHEKFTNVYFRIDDIEVKEEYKSGSTHTYELTPGIHTIEHTFYGALSEPQHIKLPKGYHVHCTYELGLKYRLLRLIACVCVFLLGVVGFVLSYHIQNSWPFIIFYFGFLILMFTLVLFYRLEHTSKHVTYTPLTQEAYDTMDSINLKKHHRVEGMFEQFKIEQTREITKQKRKELHEEIYNQSKYFTHVKTEASTAYSKKRQYFISSLLVFLGILLLLFPSPAWIIVNYGVSIFCLAMFATYYLKKDPAIFFTFIYMFFGILCFIFFPNFLMYFTLSINGFLVFRIVSQYVYEHFLLSLPFIKERFTENLVQRLVNLRNEEEELFQMYVEKEGFYYTTEHRSMHMKYRDIDMINETEHFYFIYGRADVRMYEGEHRYVDIAQLLLIRKDATLENESSITQWLEDHVKVFPKKETIKERI